MVKFLSMKIANQFFCFKVLSVFLFLLALIFPFNTLFAQITSNDSSVITDVVNENEVPLVITINNVIYSNENRTVSINFNIANKSNRFVDNLRYNFEFHQGEALKETGLLFEDLQYVFSTSDSLERLAPNQVLRKTIEYQVPDTIPGGSYFIRGTIYNEELSIYGVTYTKEPVRLTGLNRFILSKEAALIDMKNKEVYGLKQGPNLEKDGEYLIAFPREMNEQLFNALNREEIFVDYKVTHANDYTKIVYEKLNIPLSSLVVGGGLEFKIEPWENMQSGPHNATLDFKDSRGVQISESIAVRLLYKGLLGRIFDLETNINSYRKGEPINLVANIVAAGDSDVQKIFLKAIFKNEGEVVQEEQKEIPMNGDYYGIDVNVSFADTKIKSKTLIDEVQVILTSEDGTVLDEQVITMDTTQIFEYPKESNLLRNTIITLVVLLIVLGGLAFFRKKVNFTVASILIAASLIGGAIMFSGQEYVSAQEWEYTYGCTDPGACNYNSSANMEDWTCDYMSCYQGPVDDYIYGCMDPTAANFNPYANMDGGGCEYNNNPGDSGGTGDGNVCTDINADSPGTPLPCTYYTNPGADPNNQPELCDNPSASNYWQPAPCEYPPVEYICGINGYWGDECDSPCPEGYYFEPGAMGGDYCLPYENGPNTPKIDKTLLDIQSDFLPIEYKGICTEDCDKVTVYIKVQCKQCLNGADNVQIKYFNNWKGSEYLSEISRQESINIGQLDKRVSYRYWIVVADKTSEYVLDHDLKPADSYGLAGVPVAANDVVNEWVYGPYIFEFCFENYEEGDIIKELADSDGEYYQDFAILANTSFSAAYCDADIGVEFVKGERHCTYPTGVRASFYVDENFDGNKNIDEIYLRSPLRVCGAGQPSSLLGLVRDNKGNVAFSGLPPSECETTYGGVSIPYFGALLMSTSSHRVELDSENSFGWIKTGVEYLIDNVWVRDDQGFQGMKPNDTIRARIGVMRGGEEGGCENCPVELACSASPKNTKEESPTVSWIPQVGAASREYDVNGLIFVWNAVGYSTPNNAERPGTNNGGRFNINYPSAGNKTYVMDVYAKNYQGEKVSNTARCSMNVAPMVPRCYAYANQDAIANNSPKNVFSLMESVIWGVDVQDPAEGTLTYKWFVNGKLTWHENKYTSGILLDTHNYRKGQTVTTTVVVKDASNNEASASCSIFIRECMTNDECPGENICNNLTGMCTLPIPIFNKNLTLDQNVINKGGTCNLSWNVDMAHTCTLYRNNSPMQIFGPGIGNSNPEPERIEGNMGVQPGTYTMTCVSGEGANQTTQTSGPVTCLVNPDIREQ